MTLRFHFRLIQYARRSRRLKHLQIGFQELIHANDLTSDFFWEMPKKSYKLPNLLLASTCLAWSRLSIIISITFCSCNFQWQNGSLETMQLPWSAQLIFFSAAQKWSDWFTKENALGIRSCSPICIKIKLVQGHRHTGRPRQNGFLREKEILAVNEAAACPFTKNNTKLQESFNKNWH